VQTYSSEVGNRARGAYDWGHEGLYSQAREYKTREHKSLPVSEMARTRRCHLSSGPGLLRDILDLPQTELALFRWTRTIFIFHCLNTPPLPIVEPQLHGFFLFLIVFFIPKHGVDMSVLSFVMWLVGSPARIHQVDKGTSTKLHV